MHVDVRTEKERSVRSDSPHIDMDVDAKPKQTKAATGPKAQPKKEPMTPEEKARMEARIRAKVACDKAAYDVRCCSSSQGSAQST